MQDVCHHIGGGIDSIRANYVEHAVAGKLLPRERIVDGRIRAEVAAQLGWGGNPAREGNFVAAGEPFVIKEEERTVSYNRPANRRPELVLDELRAWYSAQVVEEVVGVEGGISEIFVQGTVNRVGARLRCERYGATGKGPDFRTRDAGHHSKFLNRILGWHQDGVIAHDFIQGRSIEEEGVLAGEATADLVIPKSRDVGKVSGLCVVTGRASLRSSLRDHPRHERQQVHDISAVEGSFLYLSALNHLADRGILSVERRGLFLDLYAFIRASHD